MRTPYNKDQGAGVGQEGARRGYAVVCQDTRGRFASQGEGIAFIGDGWGAYPNQASTHGVGQAKAGELTFPNGGQIPGNVPDPWRWFDFELKGQANGADKLPAVTYYVMGDTTDPAAPGNRWRTADR